MKKTNVPTALYEEIKIAVKNILRYDRFDRFALITVLTAAENDESVENVFIKQAKMALIKHPVKKNNFAA